MSSSGDSMSVSCDFIFSLGFIAINRRYDIHLGRVPPADENLWVDETVASLGVPLILNIKIIPIFTHLASTMVKYITHNHFLNE